MEIEDSSSPDEKDFPGLFEKNASKSKKTTEESESANSDTIKKSDSKKDKKSKEKKDRQSYATLGGESEEEEPESKLFRSPSKSKKSKTFKFPSSKKEKREKSREPEVQPKDALDGTVKDKKSKDEQKAEKKKAKKEKEKEKKSKTHSSSSANDVYDIGDIQPIFGVSLGLAVERSRCHDDVKLPLVVRNCIDYLQEFGLTSEQIYKMEGVKTRLQNLKKFYNNRESHGEDFDVPTACSLLKTYLQELPEPILTTELTTRFEEASALPDVAQQAEELESLLDQLPNCNKVLLSWIFRHFSDVISNEKTNLNAQSLAVLLSAVLQMSHRLMITILCHAETLFADVSLEKYVPPITSTSPNFPETPEEISIELRKQESLLAQIHSEMNAGFVTKKREEELWETQRIITQLKRKLRMFEKRNDSMQKSMDIEAVEETIDFTLQTATDDSKTPQDTTNLTEATSITQPTTTQNIPNAANSSDKVFVGENGFLMLHKDHPQYSSLIRLQIENQELLNWKQKLQTKIQTERAECVRLKKIADAVEPPPTTAADSQSTLLTTNDSEFEKLIEHYVKENALLEQKRQLLTKEIFDENVSLIQLLVETQMKQIVH